ncbi:MAG: 3'-5' exonuclease family protein [Gemmatimonadales bacterium]
MRLFLDIETIPTEDPAIIAEIAAGITAPGNYKNPDSIAKWEAENKPALVDEAVKKTGFDATYGSLCCIGFAWEDEPPQTLLRAFAMTEFDLLRVFFGDVLARCRSAQDRLEVVGHNVPWDLRFIYQRAIVNNVRPPTHLMACIQAKPWGENVRDTMLMWNPERDRRISLDKLCRLLRVPTSKGEMDGSKVWDAYKAGEFAKIGAYCEGDVAAVRQVFKRLSFIPTEALEQAA